MAGKSRQKIQCMHKVGDMSSYSSPYLPAKSTKLILLIVSQGTSDENAACRILYKLILYLLCSNKQT